MNIESDLLIKDPALAEIVKRLVEAFQPERVCLFGSKARGDTDPDSDYDLILIVPDDAQPPRLRNVARHRHSR
jgi:predicted nucleotidyltransferase